MKSILTEPKLLNLLTHIEDYFGYNIQVTSMLPEDEAFARCSMSLQDDERWVLLHPMESKVSQSTLCHELMHLVLWIEGWPGLRVDPNYWIDKYTDYRNQTLSMLCNMIPHLEVWKMTSALGFDEAMDYEPGNIQLINQVAYGVLLEDAHINLMTPSRGAYLTQGLLCPGSQGTANRLRHVAKYLMPQALEVADSILEAINKHAPLNPQSCITVLGEIFEIIGAQKKSLQAFFYDKESICPDFRTRIFL